MDVAELYLSLTRPSGIPVVGECLADGFLGQVQIEKWSWNLMNDEEIKRAGEESKDYDQHAELLKKQPALHLHEQLAKLRDDAAAESRRKSREASAKSYGDKVKEINEIANPAERRQKLQQLEKERRDEERKEEDEEWKAGEKFRLEFDGLSRDLSREERKYLEDLGKQVKDASDKISEKEEELKNFEEEYARKNKSYEFNFSKRVDFATTQMLNSMKAGDVFPMAVLTIHQRSSNAGMALIFTVTNLRLLDYSLRAEVSETMTDMKEQWKAEFRSLAYVYKNRRAIDTSDTGAEKATKALTQGTVRTFMMKKDLGI